MNPPAKKYPAGILVRCGHHVYIAQVDTDDVDVTNTALWSLMGLLQDEIPALPVKTRQEAVNIALAKMDGWRFGVANVGPKFEPVAGFWAGSQFFPGISVSDYWNQHEHIMKLVNGIKPEARQTYQDMLVRVVEGLARMAPVSWLVLTATPAQHCEAYVRTHNRSGWDQIVSEYPEES